MVNLSRRMDCRQRVMRPAAEAETESGSIFVEEDKFVRW